MADRHNEYRWRKISTLVRSNNPICQFIDKATAQQCQRPSEIVHHLVDPKDAPEQFYDWAILVAVCAEHHQGGQRGETQGYVYCHTIGPNDSIYPHGHGFPLWHRDYRPRPNPLTEPAPLLPPGSTASSVGDDILNRALAMEI